MSQSELQTEVDECVGQVLEIADLVADAEDVDQEALLTEALSRVRKRGHQ